MPLPGGSAEELRLLAGVHGGCWDPTPYRRARPVNAALISGGCSSRLPRVVTSVGTPVTALRVSRFLVDPSARRAVYTSFILVTEPHPSKSAESMRATLQAREPRVWA